MTPEQLERIFDPFAQAESGITRKYGGTGLGLAITKFIIEMMGGNLSVESTPDVGSKFSFELTFDTITVDSQGIIDGTKIVLGEMKKPAFEGEILLFEDNVMNQHVICEHLTRVGLKSVVAKDGKIGLDILQQRISSNEKLFDLILMDIHMPEMDGLETSERIGLLNTGIPIVALTANIMLHDRELYKSKGMNEYLGKPFTSQELWRCLMKYFTPVQWKTENKDEKAEEELRQKLINNFINSNRNKHEEIKQAIASGDIKLAHRLAHTLKSNAGQLKENRLQQLSENIENSLKDGKNLVTPEQIASFEKELNAVLLKLTPAADELSEVLDISSDTALSLLGELEPMLKNGDSDCLALIKDLRMIPESGELIRQIENFDFKPALETLNRLRAKIEQ
jgi:CheY-like chemotaxis protein